MPEISRFLGIVIAMFYRDHAPPHFHAIYGEYEVNVMIETFEILGGSIPHRALGLVLEWAVLHRRELRRNWNRARRGESLQPIKPLE